MIIGFFILMLIKSAELHEIRRFGEMGSGFWPAMTLSVATLLSIILLISTLIKYKKQSPSRSTISKEANVVLRDRRKKFIFSVILLLIYIVVMPWIGFILSTFIYVFVCIFALGERRKKILIFSPILVTALLTVTFVKLIAIPLPRGMGIFAALSRLVP